MATRHCEITCRGQRVEIDVDVNVPIQQQLEGIAIGDAAPLALAGCSVLCNGVLVSHTDKLSDGKFSNCAEICILPGGKSRRSTKMTASGGNVQPVANPKPQLVRDAAYESDKELVKAALENGTLDQIYHDREIELRFLYGRTVDLQHEIDEELGDGKGWFVPFLKSA